MTVRFDEKTEPIIVQHQPYYSGVGAVIDWSYMDEPQHYSVARMATCATLRLVLYKTCVDPQVPLQDITVWRSTAMRHVLR